MTLPGRKTLGGVARRTLGIILLLATVFLWTVSNFLASVSGAHTRREWRRRLIRRMQTIFADDSFSKPYFVTYINTSFFSIFLLGILIRRLWGSHGSVRRVIRGGGRHGRSGSIVTQEHEAFLKPTTSTDLLLGRSSLSNTPPEHHRGHTTALSDVVPSGAGAGLDVRETAKLSLEFCILWVRSLHTLLRQLHTDEL